LVSVGILGAVYMRLERMDRAEALIEEERALSAQQQAYSAAVRSVLDDKSFLARDERIRAALAGESNQEYSGVQEVVRVFAEARPQYRQVRVVDRRGGRLFATSSDTISDRELADQAFDALVFDLAPGQHLVSGIDFTHGYRHPIVRFGSPVYAAGGRFLGIISADLMLEGVFARIARQYGPSPSHALLIDRQGQWVKVGAGGEVLEAYGAVDRSEGAEPLEERFPDIARAIEAGTESGIGEDGVYAVSHFELSHAQLDGAWDALEISSLPYGLGPTVHAPWYLASYRPLELLLEESAARLRTFALGGVGILAVLFAVANAVLRSRRDRKIAVAELAQAVDDLRGQQEELVQINALGELMQSCDTEEEIYAVCEGYGPQLFRESSGVVYIRRGSDEELERAAVWGNAVAPERISREECWAVRRGHRHEVYPGSGAPVCRHFRAGDDPVYAVCVPFVQRGEMFGVLCVSVPSNSLELFSTYEQRSGDQIVAGVARVAEIVAGRMALSLANVRLRDRLRTQSIRDALTGLFNRRFLDETLVREVGRAKREGAALSLIMLDMDHFKAFNDRHGHEAGDRVLARVGRLIDRTFRESDVGCRYGGEEFAVVLPHSDGTNAAERAEVLRSVMEETSFQVPGGKSETVTVSCGVVEMDARHESAEELLGAADAALYAAKREGRNRVVLDSGSRRRESGTGG